jgi:hypothetical protein
VRHQLAGSQPAVPHLSGQVDHGFRAEIHTADRTVGRSRRQPVPFFR